MEPGNNEPMIFGFGFDETGHHTPLTWDDVLEGGHAKYKRVWLHLDRHSAQAQGWLFRKSGLDRVTVQALLQEETRPRAAVVPRPLRSNVPSNSPSARTQYGKETLASGGGQADRGSMSIQREPDTLVSDTLETKGSTIS